MPKVLTTATISVVAFFSLGASADAQKRWNAPPIVTNYCSGCHGVDGNTNLPYFPRLAGLDPTYAEKKLSQFGETPSPPVDEMYHWMQGAFGRTKSTGNLTRNERINMEGVAHAAKPEVIKQAVLWYAEQCPAPGRTGNKALIEQGQELFTKGIPAEKILACMTCHGPSAEGKPPAPRLAGQNADYIEAQLDKFRRGDRKHAPEMTMVTRDLNPEQAHSVAAYLQSK